MNKSFLIATAVAVGLAIATPAKAERILLHMLGEAQGIGGLAAANALAGTSVSEGDVLAVTGESIDPADYTCQLMPLLDPASKIRLGSGIDCLYLIHGGVVAVSFFVLPGGSLVNAGLTSLAEFTPGVGDNPVIPGDPSSPPPFFMTGSIPSLTDDSIIAATGDFEGLVGTGRVSGAVFPGPVLGSEEFPNFWFNCLWELNLESNPGFANAAAGRNNRN